MPEWYQQLPRHLRWAILFPLYFLNGWLLAILIAYLQPLVNNFIAAALLAFLLDHPIIALQKRGVKRSVAIALVLVAMFFVLGMVAVFLFPLLLKQLSDLAMSLPGLMKSAANTLDHVETLIVQYSPNFDVQALVNRATGELANLSSQLLTIALKTANNLANLLLIFILSIFFIVGGEELWDGLFRWLPRTWGDELRQVTKETFQNYFAGQAILALIFAVTLAIGFWAFGIPYAILFACVIGFSTLIPYAGAISTTAITLVVLLQNMGVGLRLFLVSFVIGQINDQVITPRLMGKMVGLNPVWLLVALLVGGKIAGVLGLVLAVPLASVIKTMADRQNPPEDKLPPPPSEDLPPLPNDLPLA